MRDVLPVLAAEAIAESMALFESQAIRLGSACPDFHLPSVEGGELGRNDFKDKKVLVVMFICRHCPYVIAVEERIVALRRAYEDQGVQFVGICANDAADYPDDAPAKLAERAREMDYGFPYLVDESQVVARAFGAVCTPDLYVYDAERKLAYHGRIDDSWQELAKATTHELADALDALVAGTQPASKQIPSMGCSIKWKRDT
ncbi:MAG: thioredoxin family protein [bacterium]